MESLTLRTIKTEDQYRQVMTVIENLLNSKADTPEFELLEVLSLLADEYENKFHQMPQLDPIDAIKYEMEEKGLMQKDLIGIIGSKSKVSEILNRKTNLTTKMIKSLYHDLGIPASVLLA